MEPTPDIKNAGAACMSMRDYLNRNDSAATDRAVLMRPGIGARSPPWVPVL
jgi:hypothetical protein